MSKFVVDKTLAPMPDIVGDMVRLQRLCGCRPSELVLMRVEQIDRCKEVWEYTIRRWPEWGRARGAYRGRRLDVNAEMP